MKQVVSLWTPEQWAAIITTIFAGIASVISSWRTGQKLDRHDERATARARERGEDANPRITSADRGHLK